MTTLIIDADSIVYAAAFAAQDWAIFDEEGRLYDTYSLKGDAKEAAIHADDRVEPFPRGETDAFSNTDAMMKNIVDQFDSVDDVQVWLTIPDLTQNFRYAVTDQYKANRKNFEKPFHYQTVRDRLLDHWKANMSRAGWEADDELSAAGWEAWLDGDELPIICSIDKDLDTVPGWHYRWPTHNKEGKKYYLTAQEAAQSYWVSVLTGDTADNIKGLHRVGPKKAMAMIEDCVTEEEFYSVCKDKWIEYLGKQDYTEEEAIEQMHTSCKLLYLMRGDDDEGWRPPQ